MKAKLILPLAFLGILVLSAWAHLEAAAKSSPEARAAAITSLAAAQPPPVPGGFPGRWIYGADCSTEPKMQVHAYNEDTYIIRQSKCESYEAPFMYLLFGQERALLMDTGANPQTPLQPQVEEIIRDWLRRNQKTTTKLIVQHTHGHFDHVQADGQFPGTPFVVVVVGTGQQVFERAWGFRDYPNDTPTIDLGGRVLDVLGTPGHHPASVSLYDRNTHLLLTGDIVYPGHLFVFTPSHWPQFVTSIQKLVDWAATHPVEWVLGCHIEMSATPFGSFAYTTPVHPDEHVLQFHPRILAEILSASLGMGGDPQCEIFAEFVIHPVYKCGIKWNG